MIKSRPGFITPTRFIRSLSTGVLAGCPGGSIPGGWPRPPLCLIPGLAAFLLSVAALPAQPASPVDVTGEPMELSYAPRNFDGVAIDSVVLTARSLQLTTDNLGAWTPHRDGTTDHGFDLRHRRSAAVFVTLCPFAGRGPGRSTESWRAYAREVARQRGPATTVTVAAEPGTPGGTASFASWATREMDLSVPGADGQPARIERHLAAGDGDIGILIILTGPASDVAAVEDDFRFLLARLARVAP